MRKSVRRLGGIPISRIKRGVNEKLNPHPKDNLQILPARFAVPAPLTASFCNGPIVSASRANMPLPTEQKLSMLHHAPFAHVADKIERKSFIVVALDSLYVKNIVPIRNAVSFTLSVLPQPASPRDTADTQYLIAANIHR